MNEEDELRYEQKKKCDVQKMGGAGRSLIATEDCPIESVDTTSGRDGSSEGCEL